jgi:transposase
VLLAFNLNTLQIATPELTHEGCQRNPRRLARRIGKLKAIVAVGRFILFIVWRPLSDSTTGYRDLGPEFYNPIRPERRKINHIRELEALDYTLTRAA